MFDPQVDSPVQPVMPVDAGLRRDAGVVLDSGVDAGLDAGARDAGLDAGAALDAGTEPPFNGSILVTTTGSGLAISASFSNWTSFPQCVERQTGLCRTRTCQGRGASSSQSAGTLTATVHGRAVTLTRDAMGRYSGRLATTLVAGDVVQLTASGDAVPAFTTSVDVLPASDFTSPVCGLFVPCAGIARTTPPTFQWRPIAGATVTVTTIWEDFRGAQMATCEWPSTSGSGTIEPTVWASIPPEETFVLLGSIDATKTVTAGEYVLTVTSRPETTLAVVQ